MYFCNDLKFELYFMSYLVVMMCLQNLNDGADLHEYVFIKKFAIFILFHGLKMIVFIYTYGALKD